MATRRYMSLTEAIFSNSITLVRGSFFAACLWRALAPAINSWALKSKLSKASQFVLLSVAVRQNMDHACWLSFAQCHTLYTPPNRCMRFYICWMASSYVMTKWNRVHLRFTSINWHESTIRDRLGNWPWGPFARDWFLTWSSNQPHSFFCLSTSGSNHSARFCPRFAKLFSTWWAFSFWSHCVSISPIVYSTPLFFIRSVLAPISVPICKACV